MDKVFVVRLRAQIKVYIWPFFAILLKFWLFLIKFSKFLSGVFHFMRVGLCTIFELCLIKGLSQGLMLWFGLMHNGFLILSIGSLMMVADFFQTQKKKSLKMGSNYILTCNIWLNFKLDIMWFCRYGWDCKIIKLKVFEIF